MIAVKNQFTTPTKWLEPMIMCPPPEKLTGGKRPHVRRTLQDRLKKTWFVKPLAAAFVSSHWPLGTKDIPELRK